MGLMTVESICSIRFFIILYLLTMAHFAPHLCVDDLIVAAEENNIDSLVSNVLSLATQMNVSSFTFKESSNDEEDENQMIKRNIPEYSDSCKAERSKSEKKLIKAATSTPSFEMNLASDAHGIQQNISNVQNFMSVPSYFCTSTSHVDAAVVEIIENDLQFFEKVSMVFLLYDSDDLALQRLKTAYKSQSSGSITHCRLLSDWAMHETSGNWQDKFVEALCIIKNNMWVKKLGFSIEEVNIRFLPHNREASLYVDLLRKSLYIICESLSYHQLEQLQMLVDKDMENIGRLPDKYNVEFMEMNILHWMSQRYLNAGIVGSCDVNVKNLTKHLKVMEEICLVDYLESISRRCYKSTDNNVDPLFSDQQSVKSAFRSEISSHSVVSQCQEESSEDSINETYDIDPYNVGFCVIINQKTFHKEPDPCLKHLVHQDCLEPRIGTDVDRDRLCEIFMSYGFNVKIWENLTHIEIIRAIQESTTKLVKKEHSCFVLCLLSHGRKNAVYGVNSIAVEMEDIQKLLHGKYCPNLLHKPKIIIVQACQGLVKQNAYISDISEDGIYQSKSSPEVSDTITFWATVPGFAAFRDRVLGSWFVRAMWDEMLQKRSVGNDLMSIFVNVNARVCKKRAPIDGELKAMTPLFSTCLRKKLVFPFHKEARKAAAKRMLERYLFNVLLNEFIETIILRKRTDL